MIGVPCTGLFGGDLGLLRGESRRDPASDTRADDWLDSRWASRSRRKFSASSCCMIEREPGVPPPWLHTDLVSMSTQDSEIHKPNSQKRKIFPFFKSLQWFIEPRRIKFFTSLCLSSFTYKFNVELLLGRTKYFSVQVYTQCLWIKCTFCYRCRHKNKVN